MNDILCILCHIQEVFENILTYEFAKILRVKNQIFTQCSTPHSQISCNLCTLPFRFFHGTTSQG